MQLKLGISILLLSLHMSCAARQQTAGSRPVALTNGKAVYKALYDSIYAHLDSLEKWGHDGVIFFRLSWKKGHFQDIRCSDKQPELLISLVSQVLTTQTVQVSKHRRKKSWFILPVRYQFQRSTGMTKGNLKAIIDKLPKVDLDHLDNEVTDPFSSFLELPGGSESLYGIPCILLPWLTVSGKIE